MKKIRLCLAIPACALLSALHAAAALEMVTTNTVDLGKLYNFDKVDTEFQVINTGAKEIAVREYITTCPCIYVIKAEESADVIKPGEKFTVKTRFDARTVHGEFSRGVWLVTSDAATPRVLLKVAGEVLPLFTGLPEETIVLQTESDAAVFTNKFTLKGVNPDYTLGEPRFNSPSVKTSTAMEKDKKDPTVTHLTVTLRPPAQMRMRGNLSIPVNGPAKIDDLTIRYEVYSGMQLRISPSKLVVNNPAEPCTRKFYVNTYSKETDATLLTYEPRLDGIEVDKKVFAPRAMPNISMPVRPGRSQTSSSSSRISCTITISPEAIQKLLAMKEPGITFAYPGHKPFTLPVATFDVKAGTGAGPRPTLPGLR
jgi:hypothetical protein